MSHTVAVIGAGIAGLTCATTLANDAGLHVVVYEADSRVGGRILTERAGFNAGQIAEAGAQLIDSGDTETLRLLARHGIELADQHQVTGAPIAHVDGKPYDLELASTDFARVYPQLRRDYTQMSSGSGLLAGRNTPLDRMSVAEYINSVFPEGMRGKLGRFIAAAYTWELCADPETLSAVYLVSMLGANARGEFDLFGAADGRWAVRDGFDQLPIAMANNLACDLTLSTPVTGIRQTSSGRIEIHTETGSLQTFDHAVVTTPFTVVRHQIELRNLDLHPALATAIERLDMGPGAKLNVQVPERPWSGSHWDGAVVSDREYMSCWDASIDQSGTGVVLASMRGGDSVASSHGRTTSGRLRADEDEATMRASAFLDAVTRDTGVSLSTRDGKATYHSWTDHQWSGGAYAFYRPGQITEFAGFEKEQAGALHFAGEHTEPDRTGVESAIVSGLRAASEVFRDLKVAAVTKTLPTPGMDPARGTGAQPDLNRPQ